jgi:hypothetical protein
MAWPIFVNWRHWPAPLADALRDRDDFKKLIADLEAKAAQKKPAETSASPKP